MPLNKETKPNQNYINSQEMLLIMKCSIAINDWKPKLFKNFGIP